MSVLQGVDLSYCQHGCDYAQMRSAGASFAYHKLMDWSPSSGFFLDSMRNTHMEGMRKTGAFTGDYAFMHVTPSPINSADFFVQHCALDQLLPVLDAETRMPDGSIPKNAGPWALAWFQRVEQQSGGIRGMLYGSTYYLMEMLSQAPGLGKYLIWLAEYHVPATPDHVPRVKAPLQQSQIAVWQWTGNGRLPGCPMPIDRDVLVVPDLQQICCK